MAPAPNQRHDLWLSAHVEPGDGPSDDHAPGELLARRPLGPPPAEAARAAGSGPARSCGFCCRTRRQTPASRFQVGVGGLPYCCRVQEIADQLLGHDSPSVDVHGRSPSRHLLATFPAGSWLWLTQPASPASTCDRIARLFIIRPECMRVTRAWRANRRCRRVPPDGGQQLSSSRPHAPRLPQRTRRGLRSRPRGTVRLLLTAAATRMHRGRHGS
jgi:hypothetical protein